MFPEHCLCSGQSVRRYHAFPANKSSLTYMELVPKFAGKIHYCLWLQIGFYSSRLGRVDCVLFPRISFSCFGIVHLTRKPPRPWGGHCRRRCLGGLGRLVLSAPGRNRMAGRCEEHNLAEEKKQSQTINALNKCRGKWQSGYVAIN